MNGKNINFEDKKIKKVFNIHDIDINKILVSKEESCGTKNLFKYFVGYNDDETIRPLASSNDWLC